MNWFKRGLYKTAQTTGTLAPPQQRPTTQRPLTYHDIGDAGSEDILNDDCEVFSWAIMNGGFQSKEVGEHNATQPHTQMFPGINQDMMWSGRFNSCKRAASIAVPYRFSQRPVPQQVIQQIVSAYKKYGLRQIWAYGGMHSEGDLIWQG